MPVRRVNVIENCQRANNFYPGCIHWHENLRLLEMLRCRGVSFNHTDHDLTTRIAGTTGPVLLAINDPLVSFEYRRRADIRGIG